MRYTLYFVLLIIVFNVNHSENCSDNTRSSGLQGVVCTYCHDKSHKKFKRCEMYGTGPRGQARGTGAKALTPSSTKIGDGDIGVVCSGGKMIQCDVGGVTAISGLGSNAREKKESHQGNGGVKINVPQKITVPQTLIEKQAAKKAKEAAKKAAELAQSAQKKARKNAWDDYLSYGYDDEYDGSYNNWDNDDETMALFYDVYKSGFKSGYNSGYKNAKKMKQKKGLKSKYHHYLRKKYRS